MKPRVVCRGAGGPAPVLGSPAAAAGLPERPQPRVPLRQLVHCVSEVPQLAPSGV